MTKTTDPVDTGQAMHAYKQPAPTRVTWRNKTLPDFMIIGAQKSGTSSLYHYLSQHPQLMPSYVKEIHYFDGGLNPKIDTFSKGLAWYCAHFPVQNKFGVAAKAFEASPLYLFNPLVPKRIAQAIPQAKLIVLLRDPAERAVSQYFHEKRLGFERLPPLDALQAEEERLRPALDMEDYKSRAFIHYSYKARGLYHDQITRFLNHFPEQNVLVVNSEKLFSEPTRALRQVLNFLNVDTDYAIQDLSPRNVGANKGKVAFEIYEYLHDYFKPHNERLYRLVGEDYGW